MALIVIGETPVRIPFMTRYDGNITVSETIT
jgi:hypothetical protein